MRKLNQLQIYERFKDALGADIRDNPFISHRYQTGTGYYGQTQDAM